MKNINKFLSLLMVLVMIFAMSVTVFAADTTYTITINNAAENHTYEAYQIFTGDISEKLITVDGLQKTVKVLANIEFASGVTYSGTGVDIDPTDVVKYSKDAADLAEALGNGDLTLEAFLADVNLGDADASTSDHVNNKTQYVISGLTAGYYLVKDQAGSQSGSGDAYTEYIIQVVGNAEANAKADVPEVEKKVTDINDSTGYSDSLKDSADYDIGDHVPFQLKATLADNVTAYEKYKVVFHDTMSAGLTYDANAKVYVDGADKTSSFTIVPVVNSDKTTSLTISCNDVIQQGATNSSIILVEYTATLNSEAVIGAGGNINTVYLEYSNDPNQHYDGTPNPDDPYDPDNPDGPETGKTPEDKVIVFTYMLDVDKVHEINGGTEALTGAGFTLYKWILNEDATVSTDGSWVAVGSELKGTEMTTFVWEGLDDGNYKLVETTTPVGYNTMVDIEFTITATHELEGANPTLETLTGTASGEITTTFESDKSAGSLSVDIINKPGTVLPITGGIGTTIFYILGAVLVLSAIVLLVTKKRMSRQR